MVEIISIFVSAMATVFGVFLGFKIADYIQSINDNSKDADYMDEQILQWGTLYETRWDKFMQHEIIVKVTYMPMAQAIIDKRNAHKKFLHSWDIPRGFA